jgi:putative glutamine amidotransferase
MLGRLVGVTWGRDLVRRSAGPGENALRYLELLADAGLTPVLLTPGMPSTVLDHLHGLLVPGGPDVSPATYERQPAAELGPTDPELDALEIETIRAAHRGGLPILGICRGQQVLNVALGGTLHQHVDHPQWGDDPSQPVHDLHLVDGSYLQRILGGSAPRVNSGHHQAVEAVAPSLRASAFSPDGQVEALEAEELRILAVQWHPEEMPDDRSTQLLVDAFAAWVAR